SLRTLVRLRTVLGVPLTALIEEPDEDRDAQYIRRAARRPRLNVGSDGLMKELLSPRGAQNLQFMHVLLPPNLTATEVLIGPGEKAGMVLDGQIVLTVGDETFHLSPGDSFQFPSTVPHSLGNRTDEPARVLWIMSTSPPVIHL